jgi:hypothetical protein
MAIRRSRPTKLNRLGDASTFAAERKARASPPDMLVRLQQVVLQLLATGVDPCLLNETGNTAIDEALGKPGGFARLPLELPLCGD